MEENAGRYQAAADETAALVADLFEQYHTPIFAYLYRLVDNRELAHDLTQETFLRLLQHGDRLRQVDNRRASGCVTIQTFPDETPLAVWSTDEYTLHHTAAWSPDGRFLLLSGRHKESGEDGLFLIETGS